MRISEREEQVIKYLHCGMTNKRIAELMGVKEKTIKFFISRINKALKTKNRLEIVRVTSCDNGTFRLTNLEDIMIRIVELTNLVKKQGEELEQLKKTYSLNSKDNFATILPTGNKFI